MARAGAGGPAGKMNRRYLLLALVCAALSAVLVFAAISRSSGGTTSSEASPNTADTVVAKIDIAARTQITAEMVEVIQAPVDSRATTALGSVDDAIGKVTRYPLVKDEQITANKLVSIEGETNVDSLSFIVPAGMRAISIQADQVLSAGGLVLPGDYVDIMGVLKGLKPDGSEVDAFVARTILQNVQVVAVAQTITDGSPGTTQGNSSRTTEAKPNPQATTLTILVTPEQAELLFLAESNGTLRAIVRGFGDAATTDVRPIYKSEVSAPAP